MIKAILFDLDGVLVETRPLHVEALCRALDAFSIVYQKEQVRDMVFRGNMTRNILRSLEVPERLRDPIFRLKKSYEADLFGRGLLKPTHKIIHALARLREGGFLLGVVTSAGRDYADRLLDYLWATPIHNVVTADDVSRTKPDPEPYQRMIKTLSLCGGVNLTPDQCLVVEDGDDGVESAIAAGCNVLRVSGPEEVTYERILESISCSTY